MSCKIGSCAAPQCLHPQKAIKQDSKVCSIKHDRTTHIFHEACFALELSKDFDFLQNGRLIHCPFCNEDIREDTAYPRLEDVAKFGFCFHIVRGDSESVRKIIRSGCIDEAVLQKTAARHPEVARIIAEERAAQARPLIEHSPRFLKLQSMAAYFRQENPSATLPQLRDYLASVGEEVSLATVASLVKN